MGVCLHSVQINSAATSFPNNKPVGHQLSAPLQHQAKRPPQVAHVQGRKIGIHNRENDLVVNPLIGKKVSNVRSVLADEALVIVTPIKTTLEYSLQFINDDELVEVTPKSIRIRKRFLLEHERKRAEKK